MRKGAINIVELTEKQIEKFSAIIRISDIKDYINSHLEEYQEFLKNRTCS